MLLGLTFKENCPDLRNTRVVDIIRELAQYDVNVDVYDPWVEADEARREYGVDVVSKLDDGQYDGVIIAVAHKQFVEMGAERLRALGKADHVLYDLKYVLPQDASDLRL